MTNNLFADMRAHVIAALHAAIPDLAADATAKVEVTPTRAPAHGDMATNAALVAAKAASATATTPRPASAQPGNESGGPVATEPKVRFR